MFSIDMANVSPVPISNWINKDFEKCPFDRDKYNFNIPVFNPLIRVKFNMVLTNSRQVSFHIVN